MKISSYGTSTRFAPFRHLISAVSNRPHCFVTHGRCHVADEEAHGLLLVPTTEVHKRRRLQISSLQGGDWWKTVREMGTRSLHKHEMQISTSFWCSNESEQNVPLLPTRKLHQRQLLLFRSHQRRTKCKSTQQAENTCDINAQ